MNLDKTLIIVLLLVLVIWGPTQLPKLAKMFGKSAKALRDGVDGKDEDDEAEAVKPKPKPKPKPEVVEEDSEDTSDES